MSIGHRYNSFSKSKGRTNFYVMTPEGPESYGYGARMAPEQCRSDADVTPIQIFKDELTFMPWL